MKITFSYVASTVLWLLAFGGGNFNHNNHVNASMNLGMEHLAGRWIGNQVTIVPSSGLDIATFSLPGGATISSLVIWTLHEDGTCERAGWRNIDGFGLQIPLVPDIECIWEIDSADGIGFLDIETPLETDLLAGSLKLVLVNKDEIKAVTYPEEPTEMLPITTYTMKRQNIKK